MYWQKFVQVEFVAILTKVFRMCRVRITKKDGETQEVADRRARRTMEGVLWSWR